MGQDQRIEPEHYAPIIPIILVNMNWRNQYRLDAKNPELQSTGHYSTKNTTELEITELPLGTSTQNYKESVMENLLHGSAEIPALISNYEEFHTVFVLRFVVKMTEQKMQ